jgi:hypothetical protein
MDYLCMLFNRALNLFTTSTNLKYVGKFHFHPHSNIPHSRHVLEHQRTLHHAFDRYLYPAEIDIIENKLRRSEMTQQAILDDFFANDVEPHVVPMDEHFEYGLSAMLDAFRPPQLVRPVHLYDVQHHYPYKWQVNAEVPFSTDSYFLKARPTFQFVFDRLNNLYSHISVDWHRRYGSRLTTLMSEQVPAKFGPLKETVFSWTHRWHHVIKSGFSDLAGLANDYYFKNRYIFPMLLHTKTAIVKKDDPNKMRTIWGCSKPWVIAETQFYWEYVAWIKLHPGVTPMLWGFETITGGWMRLNAALFSRHMEHSFITLDWSRFDKRAYFSVIHRIMLGVRGFLDFDNGYVPTKDYPDTASTWDHAHALRLQRLWLWTLDNLYGAPIVLPDGSMYERNYAGIPSGLYTTQLLDSWYNYTELATILSSLGFDPRTCIIKVQGDDSIVRLNVLIPPSAHDSFLLKMQERADYYFKSVISLEKSEVRNSLNGCEVLSYRHKHGLPYRDEIAMLAQFYHTKARNPNPSITMAQAIGFAYASCGNHKRVLLVLQDVYEYYKSQGFEPNRAGVTLVFGNSPDLDVPHLDLNHFPTVSEIKRFLLNNEYHNEETRKKTWPTDHFSYLPCERA